MVTGQVALQKVQKDEGPGMAGPFVFDSVVGGTRIELVTPAV